MNCVVIYIVVLEMPEISTEFYSKKSSFSFHKEEDILLITIIESENITNLPFKEKNNRSIVYVLITWKIPKLTLTLSFLF